MSPLSWTLTTVLVVVSIVTLAQTFAPSSRAAAAHRFSRRVGLALPPELADALGRRIRRRSRAGIAGALGGTLIVVAVQLLGIVQVSADDSSLAVWLLLGGCFAGLGVGVTIAATTERSADVDGPRVARADAVGLSDYVAPFERFGARVAVAASVVALVVQIALPVRSSVTGLSVAIVALGAISLAVFEAGSRRIIARGRPAASAAGLAWDDALRAATARDLVTAPLCLGLWGTLLLVFDALSAQPDGRIAMAVAVALVACGALIIIFFAIRQRPQRYFLRRLWPELAAVSR